MSKEKAAKLMTLSNVDRAIYQSKRNQRSHWQKLSHADWVEFCTAMSNWFKSKAHSEWDDYTKANNTRKAASDMGALNEVHKNRKRK